ncbi:MAG TPA: nucleotide exchange factor GrpE [Patescibacteria group bacterium]|nr:nucleotide exchange factor GrpE [Patescibacteria group bacterium]
MDKKRTENPKEQVEEITTNEETKECAEWQEKAANFENKFKRALADYQNLEKRLRDERGEIIRTSNRDLLLRFLPVLDTLILARQHDGGQTFQVVIDQFLDILKAEGIIQIKTVGEKFDPSLMEVVTTQEGKEGIVIQEVRPGYLLHDRLLRVAQVIVGKGESN